MSFPTGQVSFRRFKIIGAAPGGITEEILAQLGAYGIRPQDVIGLPDEVEYGWSRVDHLYRAFLSRRLGASWETHTADLRRWIQTK